MRTVIPILNQNFKKREREPNPTKTLYWQAIEARKKFSSVKYFVGAGARYGIYG